MIMTTAAPAAPPAGGAPVLQVLIALAMAAGTGAPVAWFVWRHLAGKPTVIARAARWAAEREGMPVWVTLPSYGLIVCLLTAGFGVWWDVPIHVRDGRDEGPLANPAHYPIYFALLGIFALGVISAALARGEQLPRHTVRLMRGWRAPAGSVLMIGASVMALSGFPADDLWHRVFGQDVTAWGPTHLMMIGGAVTAVLALPLLHAEAQQLGARGTTGFWGKVRGTIAIGICIVPFALLIEFDLGLPQFPATMQFLIAAFLTAWIFTWARRFFGPGGALVAWIVYLVARLVLDGMAVLVHGQAEGGWLLFLPAALLVEAVALVVKPRRAVAFGVASGLLAGSAGMAAEWVWSGVFLPLPQPFPASALPLQLTVAAAAGVAGGLLGTWHQRVLQRVGGDVDDTVGFGDLEWILRRLRLTVLLPAGRRVFATWRSEMRARTDAAADPGHRLGLAGIGLFVALMAVFAPPQAAAGTSTTVDLSRDCDGRTPGCAAHVTVALHPADAAADAVWFYALGYQGRRGATGPVPGDGYVITRMLPTGTSGEYRSADPVPMYGNWKSVIRLHRAPSALMALPLYLPDDSAISGPQGREVLVQSGQTRPFVFEPDILLREQRQDLPRWVWTAGYVAVGLAWLALLGFFGRLHARAATPRADGPARVTAIREGRAP